MSRTLMESRLARFDRLEEKQREMYRRQQKLSPLSQEWRDLEMRRFAILLAQSSEA